MYPLPCFVLLVLLVAASKIHFEEQALIMSTKQIRQIGLQDRQADKAGRLTRQAGLQDRQAYKAGRLTRQAG
jgi:hypothetical protein